MIIIDIDVAQANLKEYLGYVKLGQKVAIRDGEFKFELVQIASKEMGPGEKRRIGTGVGEVTILPSFYDPMPDAVLDYFTPTRS